MANIVSEFVRNNLRNQPDPNSIPRMSRMLLVDRSIDDIDVRDRTWYDFTALHYQACWGTTGSVAWLLRQDPPADVDARDSSSHQQTPLIYAACSNEDPEGKVRLLLDHGADRDQGDARGGGTALDWARSQNKSAAVIDMLENYRPDVSSSAVEARRQAARLGESMSSSRSLN